MELTEEGLEWFFSFMAPLPDERQRRLMAGSMSRVLARGGQKAVANASKVSSHVAWP